MLTSTKVKSRTELEALARLLQVSFAPKVVYGFQAAAHQKFRIAY